MTVAKGGAKLKESAPETKPFRENSAIGFSRKGVLHDEGMGRLYLGAHADAGGGYDRPDRQV